MDMGGVWFGFDVEGVYKLSPLYGNGNHGGWLKRMDKVSYWKRLNGRTLFGLLLGE